MAKVKNTSGSDLIVPDLGGRLVLAGGTVDVDPDAVYGFTSSANWSPADSDAQAAHESAAAIHEPSPEEVAAPVEQPPRNASTEAWAAYAVDSGKAAPADVEGKSRDELVALYGPQEV